MYYYRSRLSHIYFFSVHTHINEKKEEKKNLGCIIIISLFRMCINYKGWSLNSYFSLVFYSSWWVYQAQFSVHHNFPFPLILRQSPSMLLAFTAHKISYHYISWLICLIAKIMPFVFVTRKKEREKLWADNK